MYTHIIWYGIVLCLIAYVKTNILDLLPNTIFPKTPTANRTKGSTFTDEEDILYQKSLLNKLIISDPVEFHDRTFLSHLNQLPWSEPLFTKRVEQGIITGKHMTFCRVSNESISIPSEIIRYPNFTTYVRQPSLCPYHILMETAPMSSSSQALCWPLIKIQQIVFIFAIYFLALRPLST